MPEDQSSMDKNIIMTSADEIQQQISSISIDIQRSEHIKNKSDKLFHLLPENIKSLSESFKNLVKKIKLLIRSQEQEIKDIKIKIKDYQDSVNIANKSLVGLKENIKNNDNKKVQFEKERIEFKQIIDKVIWLSLIHI